MVRLTDTHWGIGSVLMRSVQRHLVWFWLLAVIACGEEHVKMGGSSLTQFEPLDQEISKIPSVPLTEFALHGEDLLRLELELNKGAYSRPVIEKQGSIKRVILSSIRPKHGRMRCRVIIMVGPLTRVPTS